MDIPKTITVELSDSERFVEGLKMVIKECKPTMSLRLKDDTYRLIFSDGSMLDEKDIMDVIRGRYDSTN